MFDNHATHAAGVQRNSTTTGNEMSWLIDRMSAKTAGYLVYTAAIISSERALTFGIVSNVVRADALDQEVAFVCSSPMQAPRAALEGTTSGGARNERSRAVNYARNIHAPINSSSEMRKPGSSHGTGHGEQI